MNARNNYMTSQQKGRELEVDIAKSLRDAGLDNHSTRTARSGAIYGLESDVFTKLPISIECKAQETTKFAEWYTQACNEVNKSKMPVVVWRPDGGSPFAFLKWSDLTEIMVYAIRGGWTERLAFPKPVKNKVTRRLMSQRGFVPRPAQARTALG